MYNTFLHNPLKFALNVSQNDTVTMESLNTAKNMFDSTTHTIIDYSVTDDNQSSANLTKFTFKVLTRMLQNSTGNILGKTWKNAFISHLIGFIEKYVVNPEDKSKLNHIIDFISNYHFYSLNDQKISRNMYLELIVNDDLLRQLYSIREKGNKYEILYDLYHYIRWTSLNVFIN